MNSKFLVFFMCAAVIPVLCRADINPYDPKVIAAHAAEEQKKARENYVRGVAEDYIDYVQCVGESVLYSVRTECFLKMKNTYGNNVLLIETLGRMVDRFRIPVNNNTSYRDSGRPVYEYDLKATTALFDFYLMIKFRQSIYDAPEHQLSLTANLFGIAADEAHVLAHDMYQYLANNSSEEACAQALKPSVFQRLISLFSKK